MAAVEIITPSGHERIIDPGAVEQCHDDAARLDGAYMPSRYDRYAKPFFDVFAALVGLVLVLPVFVVIALAIRLTLGRGVLFVQDRVGRDGRAFRMYKFRTMHRDRRRNPS